MVGDLPKVLVAEPLVDDVADLVRTQLRVIGWLQRSRSASTEDEPPAVVQKPRTERVSVGPTGA